MKLEGIRVLDLSQFLPGPHLTMMMADHGADVIRIESPAGEPSRELGLRQGEQTVWFGNTHRGKRSLVLNLKQPSALAAFQRLAKDADVIVESFRPGVVDRLGVGYEQLKALNPRLVYCSISAFGQTGPNTLKPAHDVSVQAETGLVSLNEGADGKPAMPNIPAADVLGSLMAMNGIVMALLRREKTGHGDYVDISMQDSLVSWLVNVVAPVFAADRSPIPKKERSLGGNAFYNLYETQDGKHLTLGGSEMKFAENLLNLLERPDLIDACRTPPGDGQMPARDFLRETFLSQPLAHWEEVLNSIDVCWAPVRSLREGLASEHLKAREMILQFPDQARPGEHVTHIGIPIKYREEPARFSPVAPRLGEQTHEILAEAGLTQTEIDEMIEQGAAVQWSAMRSH
ncbi:MAG: CaiB/BaiF CoA transferase family protein [Burkholderiaceae bacterium]